NSTKVRWSCSWKVRIAPGSSAYRPVVAATRPRISLLQTFDNQSKFEIPSVVGAPQNINFAIKTGALRDFLDNSAVPYDTANPGEEMKTADIASSARRYTMLISCTARITASERK